MLNRMTLAVPENAISVLERCGESFEMDVACPTDRYRHHSTTPISPLTAPAMHSPDGMVESLYSMNSMVRRMNGRCSG